MRKHWTPAGMLQAERQIRPIVGYSDLATLVTAIDQRHLTRESHVNPTPPTDTTAAAALVTV